MSVKQEPAAGAPVAQDQAIAGARRRTVLGRLIAVAAAAAVAVAGGIGIVFRRRGPREQPLDEADFYEPHDLAG